MTIPAMFPTVVGRPGTSAVRKLTSTRVLSGVGDKDGVVSRRNIKVAKQCRAHLKCCECGDRSPVLEDSYGRVGLAGCDLDGTRCGGFVRHFCRSPVAATRRRHSQTAERINGFAAERMLLPFKTANPFGRRQRCLDYR